LGGSKPRANAAAPTVGGFFMITKPAFSPKGMSNRVRANLIYQSKIVGRVVKTGERETARWALAS
jgi:hypothetical protein